MAYKNKQDQKEASHRHYIKNKDKIKSRAIIFTKKTREENRLFINEYKKNNPCVDCGNNNYVVLEFHHLINKKKVIANMTNNSLSVIKKEIEKCIVLCANCHRIRTRKAG